MIRLENVTKTFADGMAAVDGVSFSVAPGDIASLIGTSGCGKTTTLKLINRLIEPSGGEIFVDEQPVRSLDPIALRRSIGYVVQGAGLMPHLTVRENITLLARMQRRLSRQACRERAESLLAQVNLDPAMYAHRYPGELSGGECQRVGIARALMADPPVILMDEPFGALDPITRHHLHQEFYQLNRSLRKTIILVTHDLAEAFKLGDTVILMKQGRIVQQGVKADFLEHPSEPFVSEFVEAQRKGLMA